jgi:hypothetical protein
MVNNIPYHHREQLCGLSLIVESCINSVRLQVSEVGVAIRMTTKQLRMDTFNIIYERYLGARENVTNSERYTVFTANSSKLLLVDFGVGYGVVRDQ